MSILVTGATGRLGSQIIKALDAEGNDVLAYSQSMSLDDVEWHNVNIVVNCAATTPSKRVSDQMYRRGNVEFVERMLPYLENVDFVHFTTFSELYRDTVYQRTKMVGTSLLLTNAFKFRALHFLPLPTLDDIPLIEKICESALNGERPVVDRLKYNSMTYESVAAYVKQLINNETYEHITSRYNVKDLYEEVVSRVPLDKVQVGADIDRTLFNNGFFVTSSELHTS